MDTTHDQAPADDTEEMLHALGTADPADAPLLAEQLAHALSTHLEASGRSEEPS